jgi:hypothetical protein
MRIEHPWEIDAVVGARGNDVCRYLVSADTLPPRHAIDHASGDLGLDFEAGGNHATRLLEDCFRRVDYVSHVGLLPLRSQMKGGVSASTDVLTCVRSVKQRSLRHRLPWLSVTFHRGVDTERRRIAGEHPTETRLEALIKLEVACRLALESLPELPPETEETLRGPIETLCEVTERELARLQPGSS